MFGICIFVRDFYDSRDCYVRDYYVRENYVAPEWRAFPFSKCCKDNIASAVVKQNFCSFGFRLFGAAPF